MKPPWNGAAPRNPASERPARPRRCGGWNDGCDPGSERSVRCRPSQTAVTRLRRHGHPAIGVQSRTGGHPVRRRSIRTDSVAGRTADHGQHARHQINRRPARAVLPRPMLQPGDGTPSGKFIHASDSAEATAGSRCESARPCTLVRLAYPPWLQGPVDHQIHRLVKASAKSPPRGFDRSDTPQAETPSISPPARAILPYLVLIQK